MMLAERCCEPFNVVIPGRALPGAGPESLLPIGVMDSGLDVTSHASRGPVAVAPE